MVCGVKLYCCVSSSCNIQHKFFNILWYSFIQFFFIFYSSSVLCSDWCVVILEECTGYSHFPLLRSCVSQCDTLTQCWSGTANCSHSLADSPDRLPNIPHAQLAITFNLEHLAITNIHEVLHTSWSIVLLKKLTRPQLVKKFPTFYGTWKFFTVFTRAPPLVYVLIKIILVYALLSYLKLHFNIILLSIPKSLKCPLSFRFPQQNYIYAFVFFPMCATCSTCVLNSIWWGVHSWSSLFCSCLHSTVTSSLLGSYIILSATFSNILSLHPCPNIRTVLLS